MAIKPEELRLGNYVKDRGGKTIRIDFFEHFEKDYDCKFGQKNFFNGDEVHPLTEYTQYAQPIALTEEWLLKFGFIKIENINCWVKNWGRNGAEFVKFDDYYKLFSYQLGNANYRVIEYGVHQLQNIFYAITNQELIITT